MNLTAFLVFLDYGLFYILRVDWANLFSNSRNLLFLCSKEQLVRLRKERELGLQFLRVWLGILWMEIKELLRESFFCFQEEVLWEYIELLRHSSPQ